MSEIEKLNPALDVNTVSVVLSILDAARVRGDWPGPLLIASMMEELSSLTVYDYKDEAGPGSSSDTSAVLGKFSQLTESQQSAAV